MGFLKKLLGGEKKQKPSPATAPAPTTMGGPASAPAPDRQVAGPIDPANDPNMIKVFDAYGRELFITRDAWRDSVLKGTINKAWNDADQLASLTVQCLQDQFFEESLRTAKRLLELDGDAERSSVLLAIAYLKNNRLDESERTLTEFIQRHGERAVVLTNLAKVYADRGEHERAYETLWRGLQIDPNQDNGLLWYEALHREKGGVEGGQEALRRLSNVRGSWRAQLWLARHALQQKNLPEAMRLYQEALSNLQDDIPADLLMQMSGDLGNNGHIAELLEMTAPRFNAEAHGLQVGNNLIKSYVDLGKPDEARRIVADLYARKRPDWQATLSYWDTEIAKLQVAIKSLPKERPLAATTLTINGPVWLNPESPIASLFQPASSGQTPICFLGSSAEPPDMGDIGAEVRAQLADPIGRLSRSLPLYLAEDIFFNIDAPVQTLVPWIVDGGFVVCGVPWSEKDAVDAARQVDANAQIVVVTHIKASSNQWLVTARIVRCEDLHCIATIETTYPSGHPGVELQRMARDIEATLTKNAAMRTRIAPSAYSVPQGDAFANYLLRLEQLLAIRCAVMNTNNPHFLSGEREIIGGMIRLCVAQPKNVPVRALMASALQLMFKVNRAAAEEHREQVRLLQRQYALPEPAQKAIDQMLSDI